MGAICQPTSKRHKQDKSRNTLAIVNKVRI